jgi:hypothetical protein
VLTITLPPTEELESVTLELEHSLSSISKWESIHEKVFFSKDEKTEEETRSYVRQMVLTPNPPADLEERLSYVNLLSIQEYINAKRSATWFREEAGAKPSNEAYTSELMYFWMIQFQIPFTCDTWHFSRLMNLIKICGVKQTKPKKMSKAAQAQQMRELNEQRRAQLGTSG